MVTEKANKLLGLLRRTCPMLTDVKFRRSLYLALVKSQMSYATDVWSPSHSTLEQKAERVQRRATQIKQGELSYKERLIHVDMLPLTYDREVKDLLKYLFIRPYMAILVLILVLLRVLVTAILDDLNQVI